VKQCSVAPLLGGLLALPASIRLGWKSLPGTNASLLQKFVNHGQKEFYNIGPKLERLAKEKHSTLLQKLINYECKKF
jgi:hypothetical protein